MGLGLTEKVAIVTGGSEGIGKAAPAVWPRKAHASSSWRGG